MSVKWTVAGLEHSWHFTPRSSRGPTGTPRRRRLLGSTFLKLPDAISQPRRFLIRFLVDRLGQFLAELHQLLLHLLALRPPRHLATVTAFAVDVLQQREQFLA